MKETRAFSWLNRYYKSFPHITSQFLHFMCMLASFYLIIHSTLYDEWWITQCYNHICVRTAPFHEREYCEKCCVTRGIKNVQVKKKNKRTLLRNLISGVCESVQWFCGMENIALEISIDMQFCSKITHKKLRKSIK